MRNAKLAHILVSSSTVVLYQLSTHTSYLPEWPDANIVFAPYLILIILMPITWLKAWWNDHVRLSNALFQILRQKLNCLINRASDNFCKTLLRGGLFIYSLFSYNRTCSKSIKINQNTLEHVTWREYSFCSFFILSLSILWASSTVHTPALSNNSSSDPWDSTSLSS